MNRIASQTFLWAGAALALSGVTSCRTPDFVDVSDGALTTLSLVNESGAPISAALYKDPATCRGRSMVRPAPAPGQTRQVSVAVGNEVTVSFFQDTGVAIIGTAATIQGCAPTVTFQADAQASYEVRYLNCSVFVSQVSEAGGVLPKSRPVVVQVRTYTNAFDDSGPFCR